MEVYVVVEEYVNVEVGDFSTNVLGIYETIEQARETFEKQMEEIKPEFEEGDYEQQEYIEGNMVWSIWETDCWTVHHDTLMIVQKEIQFK